MFEFEALDFFAPALFPIIAIAYRWKATARPLSNNWLGFGLLSMEAMKLPERDMSCAQCGNSNTAGWAVAGACLAKELEV